jgi:hypothetical protein
LVSFFIDVIAGLLIGLADQPWFEVIVACAGWGIVSWLFVVLITGRVSYKAGTSKPATRIFFNSPRLSRFIVWWSSGFGISLAVASLTHAARAILHAS